MLKFLRQIRCGAALIFVLCFSTAFMAAGLAEAETYEFRLKWGSSGTGNGEFNLSSRVAVAPSGDVYVTDHSNHRIQKFDPTGGYISQWGSAGPGEGQFNFPMGIAVDASGNVYVADTSNNRIQKFNADGGFIRQWGGPGSADGEFNQPFAVSASASGHIYVVEDGNRVQKFDLDGNFIRKWGSSGTGNGQFRAPRGVAADIYGNVYVSEYTNNRVQKFTADGDYVKQWGTEGSADGLFSMPYGLAVDASGNVFVVDHGNGRVQKFDPEGNFITKFGSGGAGDGQLSFPTGVAVNASGGAYVADMYNHRVQKFQLPVCTPPPSGMVSWWGGDNNALDMVGTNNGTLMNDATYGSGKVGEASSFDGVDDYVDLPDGFADFTSGFTVGLWAKPTASGLWPRFIDLGNGQANNNILFGRGDWDNNLVLEVYDGAGSSTGKAYAVDAITNNEWHYYVATLDAAGQVKLYKDGLPLVMTLNTTGVPNNVTRINNYIGKSNWAGDSYYTGSMDEVAIFNRALSAEEIAALYNAGSAGTCRSCTPPPADMISWWPGDDSATDIAGGNDGTLQGGATYAPGKVGRAFIFDGVDSAVQAQAAITGATSFSISSWIKVNSFTDPYYMAPFSQNLSELNYFSWFTGELEFGFVGRWADGTPFDLRTLSPPFGIGVWKHLTVTYDGSAMKQYVDGSLHNAKDYAGKTLGNNEPFMIGRGAAYPGGILTSVYFDGLIDEMAVYSRALSADEIAKIYNAGCSGKCAYTIGTNTPTNGTIVCDALVGQGYDAECTITPNTGYYLSALTDNGGDVLGDVLAGTYTITNVTATHDVVATFAEYGIKRVAGSDYYYNLLSEAFGAVVDTDIVMMRQGSLAAVEYNRPGVSITLKGGYDSGFVPNAGQSTTLTGLLTIRAGSMTVEKVAVQ